MRRTRLRWLIAIVAAGCTHQPRLAATMPSAQADTIWYVSARSREQGRVRRALADSLEFGFVVSSVKSDGDVTVGAFGLTIRDSVQLSRTAFVESLRRRADGAFPNDPVAIVYVHGFGTSQHEAFEHATQSSVRSQSRIPWVVFSWPSRGSGVTWPRADAVFAQAYWEDSASAMSSRPALAVGMHAVLDAVGGAHVVLVAHSLGAQLASATLADDEGLRQRLAADPLRAFAFFAPDIDSERFRGVVVPAMLPLTRRLILYASAHDRILTLSKLVNKGDRAGLIRSSPSLPIRLSKLETVDVTAGRGSGGFLQRTFGSHHGLNRASAALFDLTHLVARGFPAECRSTLGTATLRSEGNWRLTSLWPPSPTAPGTCQ